MEAVTYSEQGLVELNFTREASLQLRRSSPGHSKCLAQGREIETHGAKGQRRSASASAQGGDRHPYVVLFITTVPSLPLS